jgi:hypothetical protein
MEVEKKKKKMYKMGTFASSPDVFRRNSDNCVSSSAYKMETSKLVQYERYYTQKSQFGGSKLFFVNFVAIKALCVPICHQLDTLMQMEWI